MVLSYFNEIYLFWNENIKYHIPIKDEDKKYIDNKINNLFFQKIIYNYKLITKNEKIGYIIFLDQFTRNMSRINSSFYTEKYILDSRKTAYKYIISNILDKEELTKTEYIYILIVKTLDLFFFCND